MLNNDFLSFQLLLYNANPFKRRRKEGVTQDNFNSPSLAIVVKKRITTTQGSTSRGDVGN
jgi:hypothetical protein